MDTNEQTLPEKTPSGWKFASGLVFSTHSPP